MADRARRALQMDAQVRERTTSRGVRRRGERVLNECTKASAAADAGEGEATASGAAARLLHHRRVRAAETTIM